MIQRGALIGCGFFAENHLNAWRDIEGAEIVALCDLDTTRLEAVGAKFGISALYEDAVGLLERERLDFVDIATTAPAHRALVTLFAGNVDTILCQKPFAETVEDADAMVRAAETSGTRLLIHENFRWQKAFIDIKSIIDEGRIGTPQFGRFSFRHGYDNYANQPYLAEIERFCIMDVGLHLFDLARYIFGDVTHLACTAQRLNQAVRGEDAFSALLTHESGASSFCDASFRSIYWPEPFPNTAATIEGDRGTLELGRAYDLRIHVASGVEERCVEPEVPSWGAKPWHGVQDSVLRLQRHAVEVMAGTASPQPSGAHNLETLKLGIAAYESVATSRVIDMKTWQERRP